MARYEIVSPGGQKFEITAPDDATEQQVMAYAQANFGKQQEERQKRIDAQIAADRELYSPTRGMSGLDKFRAGIGKSYVETGQGIQQLLGVGPSAAEVSERRRLDEPLMQTGAGMAGNITGSVVQSLALPGGAAISGAKLLPALAAGGLQGAALSGAQAVGEGESRLENAVLGGLFGAGGVGAVRGLGRLFDPAGVNQAARLQTQQMADDAARQMARGVAPEQIVAATKINPIDPRRMAVAETLQRYGIEPTLAQRTGAKPLQTLESVLAEMPATAAQAQARAASQQTGFNRALSGLLGETTDHIDNEVIGKAFDRMGKGYSEIAKGTTLTLGDDFVDSIAAVEGEYAKYLPSDVRAAFKSRLDDLFDIATTGSLSGERYQAIRSKLGSAAASTTDDAYKSALKGLQSALDAQFAKAADPAVLAEKLKLDQQYRLAKLLNDPAVLTADKAGISAAKAANKLEREVRKGKIMPEAVELLRAAGQILPDRVANSGTAQRTMMQNMLTGQATPLGLGLGAGMLTGDPTMGLAAAGAYYGGPKAIQALMSSGLGGKYLSGQLAPKVPEWLARYGQQGAGMLPLAGIMSDQ